MTGRETLLDPTGSAARTADATPAPRPVRLRGLTVGLLDNARPNAMRLLTELAAELRHRHRTAGSLRYVKDCAGLPAGEELIKELAQDCDVVLTAVGDGGSCAAATVADGVALERAGVPAVSVVTEPFLAAGRAMAEVCGFPGYAFAVVRHPVAGLGADGLRGRAAEVLPGVLSVLGAGGGRA
ncbi:UGSC family (seleno)protein [Nonomuraea sp. NPDC049419]|uniref:UGSC family (seleno)protein n=1 Tax=Nonomuraea sp. NPDC049419 TaxID=3155772 RepID=UPI003447E1B0